MEHYMFTPHRDFCHISPTAYLSDFCRGRPNHLALAHLVERDQQYTEFYLRESLEGATIILDNSAFEQYKAGLEMYPSEKLIALGKEIKAEYIVMSDYPGQHSSVTIKAAKKLAPVFHDAGFGTFFCPQSQIGDKDDLIRAFEWAATSDLVDYVGVSILAVPNAYGVERGNKLQRFISRWKFMHELHSAGILDQLQSARKKIHFLGMTDGPNEIDLVHQFWPYINTWDSSSAVWLGLNDRLYDTSPSGIVDGKFELEVDFEMDKPLSDQTYSKVMQNIITIDKKGFAK